MWKAERGSSRRHRVLTGRSFHWVAAAFLKQCCGLRYPGSCWLCDLYMTINQCRKFKTGVICSRLGLRVISRAVEFCPLCKSPISYGKNGSRIFRTRKNLKYAYGCSDDQQPIWTQKSLVMDDKILVRKISVTSMEVTMKMTVMLDSENKNTQLQMSWLDNCVFLPAVKREDFGIWRFSGLRDSSSLTYTGRGTENHHHHHHRDLRLYRVQVGLHSPLRWVSRRQVGYIPGLNISIVPHRLPRSRFVFFDDCYTYLDDVVTVPLDIIITGVFCVVAGWSGTSLPRQTNEVTL